HRDLQIALGNAQAGGGVAVHPHGPQVGQMDVQPRLHDRRQHVVGGVQVVVDRVDLVAGRLHRIGRGALFGEVDDGIGAEVLQQGHQPVELAADGEVLDADVATRDVLPGGDALAHRPDRGQRTDLQLVVDVPSGQVV